MLGLENDGRNHFYFRDDLGSPMRLADETGRSEVIYGYDEFGNDIRTAHDIFKSPMQSFGFTGYQMDEAGGLYFAQARRYDAGAGRFTSEDVIKGHIAVPYTMNHYNYCWNRPMDLVDLNGMTPENLTAGVTAYNMDALNGNSGSTPSAGVTNKLIDYATEGVENNNVYCNLPSAGVTSEVVGQLADSKSNNDKDLAHKIHDGYSKGKNVRDGYNLANNISKWGYQYAQNKNLKNSIKTSQIAEEIAASEGISVGRYKRVTKARISNGVEEMTKIGTDVKPSFKLGKGDVIGIGLDVGIGIYDNYQSGASAGEYVSDAAVDTVMSGGETLIATALGSAAAGAIGGSFAPGVGNIVGAVVGFGTGIGLYFLDNSDFDGNGKTLREDVKDSVYCAFMD